MNITAAFRQAADRLLQPDCDFCGNPCSLGQPLCDACHAELPWLPVEYHTPLPDCDETVSAFAYQPPISNLLLGIKFGKNLRSLATLGELTSNGILPQIAQIPEAILPIPLHSRRLQQRGFNQALELARPLARTLKIPLLTHTIVRSKATLPQTELDSRQRLSNLKQAFQIASLPPYHSIAIFDDVITTGTTARELALLLRNQGIRHIAIWSCARAILRQKHELTEQIDYHVQPTQ